LLNKPYRPALRGLANGLAGVGSEQSTQEESVLFRKKEPTRLSRDVDAAYVLQDASFLLLFCKKEVLFLS
jgi:hypothetical protein